MDLGILKRVLIILVLFPFLLANKECRRSTTWGDANKSFASLWEADHKDLEPDTKCSECHDDSRTPKKAPKSHNNHDIAWEREHGKFANIEYGFRNENVCVLCHQESWCSSCHQQKPPRDHTHFWRLKGHGLGVGLDRSRCAACHLGADFCERCHYLKKPQSHTALWGSPRDLHCNGCHLPLEPTAAQSCGTCHEATPSHDRAPVPTPTDFHVVGADCRLCHTPLTHADNGEDCTGCHSL